MARTAVVSTLWAGGWDKYEIDLDQTRQATTEEIQVQKDRIEAGRGADPVLFGEKTWGSWIWGNMISNGDRNTHKIETDMYVLYRILRHVGGGD